MGVVFIRNSISENKITEIEERQKYLGTLRERVIENLDMTQDMGEEMIWQEIDDVLRREEHVRVISLEERRDLGRSIYNSLRKMDVIQELIDDDEVTEILVNGWKNIFYEKKGRLRRWNRSFASPKKLEDVIQQMAGGNNKMVNESNPIVDTRLPDGSRVNIVLAPIAIDGSAISIRRFPKKTITMEELVDWNAVSAEVADFLKELVARKYNLIISGGTSSGKTTFLNALSEYIPDDERILTIEDSAELQLLDKPNLVRLEARAANFEGMREISIRQLIKSALRMRPDRIIVGEVRGAEALDMLQSMQTGHDGSLSTGHSNSPKDMVHRLETMVMMGMDIPLEAIRSQIAEGVDVIVHLGRLKGGARRVLEVCEVLPYSGGEVTLNPLYKFNASRDDSGAETVSWEKVGSLKNLEKWRRNGGL